MRLHFFLFTASTVYPLKKKCLMLKHFAFSIQKEIDGSFDKNFLLPVKKETAESLFGRLRCRLSLSV